MAMILSHWQSPNSHVPRNKVGFLRLNPSRSFCVLVNNDFIFWKLKLNFLNNFMASMVACFSRLFDTTDAFHGRAFLNMGTLFWPLLPHQPSVHHLVHTWSQHFFYNEPRTPPTFSLSPFMCRGSRYSKRLPKKQYKFWSGDIDFWIWTDITKLTDPLIQWTYYLVNYLIIFPQFNF